MKASSGVARARAHAGQARVHAVAAFLDGDDGIGHAQAQVVMRVHAGLRFGLEHILEGAEAVPHVLHAERAAGVHHVAAGRAVAFHELGLPRQRPRFGHVAHHQEADGLHAQMAGVLDVLARDVGLGAMRGHAHHAHAGVIGVLQVVHGADAGQQQRGDPGVFDLAGHGLDPFQIGVRAEAVVEAGALQAVAVRDLDGIDLGSSSARRCAGPVQHCTGGGWRGCRRAASRRRYRFSWLGSSSVTALKQAPRPPACGGPCVPRCAGPRWS